MLFLIKEGERITQSKRMKYARVRNNKSKKERKKEREKENDFVHLKLRHSPTHVYFLFLFLGKPSFLVFFPAIFPLSISPFIFFLSLSFPLFLLLSRLFSLPVVLLFSFPVCVLFLVSASLPFKLLVKISGCFHLQAAFHVSLSSLFSRLHDFSPSVKLFIIFMKFGKIVQLLSSWSVMVLVEDRE